MNDTTTPQDLPPVPAQPPAVPPAAAEPAPARRSGPGAWIAAGCALALVLAAGGGLAWLALGHRDAAARPWSAPVEHRTGSYGAVSGGAHYGKLTKLLLPVPSDWLQGPDASVYGNDTELGTGRVNAMIMQSFGKLTSAQRREATRAVKDLHVKGIGLRTYQDSSNDAAVDIILEQINPQYARSAVKGLTALYDEEGSKGPKVPGHSEAHCYTDWTKDHGGLRVLTCLADEGDLVATARLSVEKGASSTAALALVGKQLDRIADPGESA